MTQFEELYTRLISDGAFRKQLFEDPSGALTSIGIEPTPELLQAIKTIVNTVAEVDQLLGQKVGPAALVNAAGLPSPKIEAVT